MEDAPSTEAIEGHGSSTDEACQLLADETRLAVMQALWEAFDPIDPSPVKFSELRERIGVEDPGRLNYHLGELATHFIRHKENGYQLSEAGKRVMRVVISGTAIDDVTIDPTEIDVSCIFCGGSTQISYEDGLLSHRCLRCNSRCVAEYPQSLLSQEEFPPAGLLNRTADNVYPANRVWVWRPPRTSTREDSPDRHRCRGTEAARIGLSAALPRGGVRPSGRERPRPLLPPGE